MSSNKELKHPGFDLGEKEEILIKEGRNACEIFNLNCEMLLDGTKLKRKRKKNNIVKKQNFKRLLDEDEIDKLALS